MQAARYRRVIFDANLCFDGQVKHVVQSYFFQLRIITKIRSFFYHALIYKMSYMLLSILASITAMHYSGIHHGSIHCLQLEQNAAAQLITGQRGMIILPLLLNSLHWHPVRF